MTGDGDAAEGEADGACFCPEHGAVDAVFRQRALTSGATR